MASESPSGNGSAAAEPVIAPLIEPIAVGEPSQPPKINWIGLLRESMYFLAIEHSFRWATEEGTRGAKGPLVTGYVNSVTNLHGWSDGDPFYVNYVGHPMQGAIAGYIWVQNDGLYATAKFGRNREYWKSRIRAAGFAWAYSAQFEIGPFSEATIGYIQSQRPQFGFVDHVVTPTIGFGWMVAEDAMDHYVIRTLERHVGNRYVRALARSFLNPSRSMATTLSGRLPWSREDRSVLADYKNVNTVIEKAPKPKIRTELPPDRTRAPFEFTISSRQQRFVGPNSRGGCLGGGAEGAVRTGNDWQLVFDVSGCSIGGLPPGVSGDSLTYLIGPRWTPSEGRFLPYVQVLIGGNKLTHEEVLANIAKANAANKEYIHQDQTHGFALSAGTGLDLKLNRAAAIRLASLEYTRSWQRPVEGADYGRGLQLRLGLTLRMGTW
jgi:hypothetical protein